jgi:signal transduction histidine kinase
MKSYSHIGVLPSYYHYQGRDKFNLVAAALGRVQAADNRLLALQMGLREIVWLAGAKRGVLLTRTLTGKGLQPLLTCDDEPRQLYDFLEVETSLDGSLLDTPPASASARSALLARIPLKSFGNVVGAIHLDQINYLEPLAEQKRIAVEALAHHLALLLENLELSQVAQDKQMLLEMLATARQIGQRFSVSPDTQKALAEFLESGRFLFNAEHCVILAVDGEAETARLLSGYQPDVSADNLPEVSLHDTMLRRVISQGEPLLLPDVRLDERYSPVLEAVLGLEIQQFMAVPLNVRGEVLGLVGVINKNGDPFDEFDLSLLQMLAPSAAIALENAYRFAWQQAEAAQKRELYSVASHALRSPMMNILTSVEWILETGVQNKAQRTRLEDIRSQIFSLAKFAGAILDMSRIETENLPTQLLPVAITPLIKKTLTAFERRFPSHNFELQVREHIPPAYADEAQLAIVLDHLVENAVKYSPANSMIRVEIAASSEQVLISVCDEGSGIMADELEDIFARYYRGRHQPAKGHSLGLGLYIARKLVQAQGGEIWAKSVVDHGSCFTFTLLQAKIGD